MTGELSLEELYSKLENLGKVASKFEVYMAKHAEEEKHKDEEHMKAKKAEEEKHEKDKKMEEAMRKAMEEPDEHKRHDAMRQAMEEHGDHKKHEAFGKPEHEASDEEKEKEAQVAAIIEEKVNSMKNQILTANRLMNPTQVDEVEARLKVASITDIQKEYEIIKPFVAGVPEFGTQTQQKPFIPFYANLDAQKVDEAQLNANSPDSEFMNLTTKELMEKIRG